MDSAGLPEGPVVERLSDEDERILRERLMGELVTPDDESYEETRRIWNGMIDKYPAAIAQCAGTTDVVTAVDFARKRDL